MTTASSIVSSAFREGNLFSLEQTPSDAQINEALGILNNLRKTLFGHEIPIRLYDWPIPNPLAASNYLANFPWRPDFKDELPRISEEALLHPQCGARLVVGATDGEDKTVYLPYTPWDGARISFVDVGIDAEITISGNLRLIDGGADVVLSPPSEGRLTPITWFYRADISEWITLADLELTDQLPLPEEFDDYFTTALAIRLSSRYRKELEESTVERFRDMRAKLQQRYRDQNPVAGDADEIPNSYQVGLGWVSDRRCR